MISVSNLTMQFGANVLFADASFQLNPGERYGLVGANGSGKTTLLNIMSGDQPEAEGTVSIPKTARLGVLRQDQFLYEDQEILAVALMGHPELWDVLVEKEKLLANAHVEFDVDRFSELEDAFQRMDGYTAETRAATILEGLGIPTEVHREPLSTLSGGFKLRVLLAQVLAGAPDVLLLDEPTNHLDILSIRWLEKFLQNFPGPAVIISHDHRFLDNVATKILDVDYATVTLYHGNYTKFGEMKVSERERREKEIEGRQKEIAHHQKFVDRFKAKNSKARQAQSKVRMIERIADDLEELPGSSRRYPKFRFRQGTASGKDVLKIKGVKKAFGDNEVLHGVDLQVQRGDRLVIMGPNGIGKSTLLKIVMGELAADAGTVEWGHGTRPGYFAQDHHEKLGESDLTAERWLWDFCPGKDRGYVRGELGLMLFSGDSAEKSLSMLSGGEAARLVFARMQVEQPNVLVLDEPTNHLDLESIEALVAGLQNYDGTLILVSHDRWFVNQLATRVVEISRTGIRDYHGTYEEYVHDCGDDHLDADNVVLKTRRAEKKVRRDPDSASAGNGRGANAPQGSGNGKANAGGGKANVGGGRADAARARARDERLARITAEIETAEAAMASIDEAFAEDGYFENTSGDQIQAAQAERAQLEQAVERLLEEWERLEQESEAAVQA
ncbi:MAG: ABC-F family ATP-binding cassette domain-containing protein [Gemmatimonadetes bacterium]|nr:ABC-F family ATP-binding cassette domain-containing protein [Gemmatimonadota bacterium]